MFKKHLDVQSCIEAAIPFMKLSRSDSDACFSAIPLGRDLQRRLALFVEFRE